MIDKSLLKRWLYSELLKYYIDLNAIACVYPSWKDESNQFH